MKILKMTPQKLKFNEYIYTIRKRLNSNQTRVAKGAGLAYYKYLAIERGVEEANEEMKMRIVASISGLVNKEVLQMVVPGSAIGMAKCVKQDTFFLSLTAPEMLNVYLKSNSMTKKIFAKKFKFTKQNLDNWSISLVIPDSYNREKIEKATKGYVKVEYWGHI